MMTMWFFFFVIKNEIVFLSRSLTTKPIKMDIDQQSPMKIQMLALMEMVTTTMVAVTTVTLNKATNSTDIKTSHKDIKCTTHLCKSRTI